MPFGLDLGSLLFVGIALIAVFLVLDLLVAGGSMTCGVMGGIGSMMGGLSGAMRAAGSIMGGIAGAMGTPWGWGLLLLVAAAVAVLLGFPALVPRL